MNHKVKALKTYQELKVMDKELKTIPEEGFEFEVSDERLKVLTGNNSYNITFVEEIKAKKKKDIPETKTNEKELIDLGKAKKIKKGEPIPVPVDPTITDK